jgi:hypothetical protein
MEKYPRISSEMLLKIERIILYDTIWEIGCKPDEDFCCGSCLWSEIGKIIGLETPIRWDRM